MKAITLFFILLLFNPAFSQSYIVHKPLKKDIEPKTTVEPVKELKIADTAKPISVKKNSVKERKQIPKVIHITPKPVKKLSVLWNRQVKTIYKKGDVVAYVMMLTLKTNDNPSVEECYIRRVNDYKQVVEFLNYPIEKLINTYLYSTLINKPGKRPFKAIKWDSKKPINWGISLSKGESFKP